MGFNSAFKGLIRDVSEFLDFLSVFSTFIDRLVRNSL